METKYPHLRKWTRPDNYAGESWPNHYSAGVGQSRDSDCLERSNFEVMWRMLSAVSEEVQIVRESHWAVGWIEWIAIPENDDAALGVAERAMAELEDYPVLDEENFAAQEDREANEIWSACYRVPERIEYIRQHRNQFDFRSLADMLGCVRGEYFAGYASELINR